MNEKIKVFENQKVRTAWNEDEEEWYFSVVDVCRILADSQAKDIGAYWRKLKQRLSVEGSEVVTNCHELKLPAADGKTYKQRFPRQINRTLFLKMCKLQKKAVLSQEMPGKI